MKISFNRYEIILILLELSLVKPDSFGYVFGGVLDPICIVIDVIGLICLIVSMKKYALSKSTVIIFLMYSVALASTILHNGQYNYIIKMLGTSVLACLLAEFCTQNCFVVFLKTNVFVWGVMYIINLIQLVLFPSGIYLDKKGGNHNWIMGYDNGFIYTLIPYVGYALIYSLYKCNNYISILSIIAISLLIITEMIIKSGTGIAVTAVFLFLLIFLELIPDRRTKKMIPIISIAGFFIFSFTITVFRRIDVFSDIIVHILKKDMTFTGRTYMWDYAISVIKNNLIIGIGQHGYSIKGFGNLTYLHPHSMILNTLYIGGIIMLILLILLLFRFAKNISINKSSNTASIIMCVVIALLTSEIVNSTVYLTQLWIFIVMAERILFLDQIFDKKMQTEDDNVIT